MNPVTRLIAWISEGGERAFELERLVIAETAAEYLEHKERFKAEWDDDQFLTFSEWLNNEREHRWRVNLSGDLGDLEPEYYGRSAALALEAAADAIRSRP